MTLPIPARAGEYLAAGRIVAGAGAWLTPGLSARLLRLQPGPTTTLGLRLFGVRDVAVGIGYLQSGPEERRRWLLLGAAMDGADAVAAMIAGSQRALPWASALLIALTATAAGVTGAQARRTV